jgi:trans-aconitate 2-methyltransferase
VSSPRSARPTADWNPEQYGKFADERARPFLDLLALVGEVVVDAVDLGCGTGELTALAASRLDAASMLGVDNSPAMLAAAQQHAADRVRFEHGDIGEWVADATFDLVLANAALQWVPDHRRVLTRWTQALRPGGQLAVQVPANAGQPSHTVSAVLAQTEPFLSAFGADGAPLDPVREYVLEPEEYARLLHDLGFVEQHVRLQVYAHVLPTSRHVVEWVRGTSLTRFEKRLPPELYAEFLRRYEDDLVAQIGEHAPYFFPFRRILMWGRLG